MLKTTRQHVILGETAHAYQRAVEKIPGGFDMIGSLLRIGGDLCRLLVPVALADRIERTHEIADRPAQAYVTLFVVRIERAVALDGCEGWPPIRPSQPFRGIGTKMDRPCGMREQLHIEFRLAHPPNRFPSPLVERDFYCCRMRYRSRAQECRGRERNVLNAEMECPRD